MKVVRISKLLIGSIPNSSIAIIGSAMSFAAAFIWADYYAWMIFFFLIPIFIILFNDQISFVSGLYWGLIAWSLHLIALLVFLFEHGTDSMIMSIICWILLVMYLSTYSGVWFYSATQCLTLHNKIFTCLAIAAVSTLYFWWVDSMVFWIFGRQFGYPYSFPLLPLIHYSKIGWFLAKIGLYGSCYVLCLLNVIIAQIIVYAYKDILTEVKIVVSYLIFVIFMISGEKEQGDLVHADIMVIHPQQEESAWLMAQYFLQQCLNVVKNNPNITIIATPESAFPFPLNLYPEFIAMWSDYPDLQHIHFLIGAHRQEEQKLFNTLYHVLGGRIIQHYDKKTTLLFAEEQPTLKIWCWTKNLLLKNKHPMSAGTAKRPTIAINDLMLKPYICSDLFFCNKKPRTHLDIICIANDSWFSVSYMKRLMKLVVKSKFLLLNCNIIYIA